MVPLMAGQMPVVVVSGGEFAVVLRNRPLPGRGDPCYFRPNVSMDVPGAVRETGRARMTTEVPLRLAVRGRFWLWLLSLYLKPVLNKKKHLRGCLTLTWRAASRP